MLSLVRRLRLWRYPAAAGIVLMSTLASALFYGLLDIAGQAMVYLTGVLVAAVTLGAAPAYFAAILAFAIYNYYLVEPRFILQLDSTEDFLAFGFFLGVAMLTGGWRAGSGTTPGATSCGPARPGPCSRPAGGSPRPPTRTSCASIWWNTSPWRRKARPPSATGERGWRHPADIPAPPFPAGPGDTPDGWRIREVEADGADLGLVAWRTAADERDDPERDRLISVLIDLGAAAIARARLAAVQSDLVATAKTEQLRNALLASISHDLRTPLAAILASATSLRTFGPQFSPDVRDDLMSTIEEEAERLNQFVANLLSMTKLESGALSLERQVFDAAEVVNRAADRIEKSRRREVRRSAPRPWWPRATPSCWSRRSATCSRTRPAIPPPTARSRSAARCARTG
ncbi:MAG: DUF4118 domain-containing protein [Caulobacteraceae bacterium]